MRNLTLTTAREELPGVHAILARSPVDVGSLRDATWKSIERAYHTAAVEEINQLVRQYNALTPYFTRHTYYMREVELD